VAQAGLAQSRYLVPGTSSWISREVPLTLLCRAAQLAYVSPPTPDTPAVGCLVSCKARATAAVFEAQSNLAPLAPA
jgi:hypothetical protein